MQSMTLQAVERLVQILANQMWVRYYREAYGADTLVIEVMDTRRRFPERLHADLTKRGFELMQAQASEINGCFAWRWKINRLAGDAARAEGGE